MSKQLFQQFNESLQRGLKNVKQQEDYPDMKFLGEFEEKPQTPTLLQTNAAEAKFWNSKWADKIKQEDKQDIINSF